LQPSTLAKRAWLLFFLVVGLSFLYGLGHFPFVGPDEPRYAQVAREMFLRRDLITPTLGGYPWFEKPALLYWMMMASFSVFGVSEWTARLGPAISGLLTVAAVYWIGHRIDAESRDEARVTDQHQGLRGSQSKRGTFAALVAASSGGLIVFSRGASFDILITMSVTFALAFFLASEIGKAEKNQRGLLAGFWCFVGLSLLAKGLVGIVVPFGIIAAYFCLRRRWPNRRMITSLFWGVPLALIVAGLWYGPVIARNGWPFIDQFFVQHHFARYLSNKYHHPQPIYFYLPVILLFLLPWTPFLIEALFRAFKAKPWRVGVNDAESKSLIFLLAWFFFPLAFFSLSGSKLPGYVLPSLPAAALLAGDRLAVFVDQRSKNTLAMRSTGVVLLLLSPLGMVYAERFGNLSLRCSLLVISPLLLAGVVAVVWAQRRILAATLIVLAVLTAVMLALSCAADIFTERETVRELIITADARGYGSAPLFMFEKVERTAEFYAAGRVAYGRDGEPVRFELVSQIVNQARQTRGPILIILRPRSVSQLTNAKELKTTLIGTNGSTTLVAVQLE
jgi:4-amino-4-deoxy-L-arabinose transferase-like glycosyltransferase